MPFGPSRAKSSWQARCVLLSPDSNMTGYAVIEVGSYSVRILSSESRFASNIIGDGYPSF